MSRVYGWRRDIPDPRDCKLGRTSSWLLSLRIPRSADLSTMKFPRVEDQGAIGSCTCNAGTSAVEYIALQKQHEIVELSRLFLYYIVRVAIERQPAGEDTGAQIRDVMKALAKYGVCAEDVWPYRVELFSAPPSREAVEMAKRNRITRYFRCPTLASIKISIASGWPVVGGFSCPESIECEGTTKTGLVRMPENGERIIGGHAVLFVGYNDDDRVLKFENSWGCEWGAEGFGYLPYEYVTGGLADDFWTIRDATGV